MFYCILTLTAKQVGNNDDDGTIDQKPYYVPRIPLSEVKSATNDFSDDNKLGSGGYGDVFKGIGPDGTPWAVKRAKVVSEKNLEDFTTEAIVSQLLFI